MKTTLITFARRSHLFWCVAIAIAIVAQSWPAGAVDCVWINPSGGNFGDSGNWWPGGPPTPWDRAVFDLTYPAYTIAFDNDYTHDRLSVDAGDVTLDLQGHAYNLTHDFFSDYNHPVEIAADPAVMTGARLTVINGTVAARHTMLGRHFMNVAELVVSRGAYWDSLNDFDTIAVEGSGQVTIEQGGRFAAGYMYVGLDQAARGSVAVTGAGSLLDNPWFVTLGRYGSSQGSLTVEDGAEARIGQILLGETAMASGSVLVDGQGSLCNLAFTPNSDQSMLVGDGGTGTVTVQRGARLWCDQNGVVGSQGGSSGTIVVRDAGTRMDVGGFLRVGHDGRASLEVLDGALVNVAESVRVASYGESNGRVLVEGAGSRLVLGQGFILGGELDSGYPESTVASMTIRQGGAISVGADVGFGFNSRSFVTGQVDGAGSIWSIAGVLYMGQYSGPTTVLTVSDGGQVDAGSVVASPDAEAHATILVTGPTSRLVSRGPAVLGGYNEWTSGGSADVRLENGGRMTAAGPTTIHGSGALILDGGTFSANDTIHNAGQIRLGSDESLLRGPALANRGLITGQGRIEAFVENLAEGEIRGQRGGTLAFTDPNTDNYGTVNLAGGELAFSGTLVNVADAVIVGQGELRAADLENFGAMAFSAGTTNVYGDVGNQPGGRVITSGGGTTTFWDDVINDGEIRTSAGCATVFLGDLSGSGACTGTGTVYFEGDVKPGSSPASVAFGGDVVFAGTSRLEIEIGGTLPGDEYDTLAVAGAVNLDGQLLVEWLDEYRPRVGDRCTVMTFASRVGEFRDYEGLLSGGVPLLPLYEANALVLVAAMPGDANADGDVNALDAAALAAHWLLSSGAQWTDGDFNADGRVDDLDLAVLAANWTVGAGSGAVPEPGVLALVASLAIGALGWVRRRGRKSRPSA
ncbi:MAG: hypothetical protein JW809_11535 [Pirellulales bacterium]|nr:hypothetical protein [Pirellulales bacterium]